MPHVVLLGDSILDNQAYVDSGHATIDALRARLPDGWDATLLARDGSLVSEVESQIEAIPRDATHLVVSAGGNDALMQVSILEERVTTIGSALLRLHQVAYEFERDYRSMLAPAAALRLPLAVCTIYNGNFPESHIQRMTSTALTIFNDAIIRAAWAYRAQVLDLRTVCDGPECYANEIEPSAFGSAKIAEAILSLAL